MKTTDLTRKQLDALEKVWAAEIDGHLPFQSRAKIYKQLCTDGLLSPMERRFGGGEAFSVLCTGYQLTHAGRLAYCSSCSEPQNAAAQE